MNSGAAQAAYPVLSVLSVLCAAVCGRMLIAVERERLISQAWLAPRCRSPSTSEIGLFLDCHRLRSIFSQTRFPGADDCLRPIRYLQLEEDVRDVVPHRLETHEQLPGYLLVALSLGH